MSDFTAVMKRMGTVEGFLGEETTASSLPPGGVNSHVHLPPNFTAFETTTQAIALANAQDVRVLGASNYYDYTVYREFAAQSMAHGIFPLFGIEIISLIDDLARVGIRANDPGNPGKMYVCGKGITRFDPLSDEGVGLLQVIRDSDSARMSEVTQRLTTVFSEAGLAVSLDANAIKHRIAGRHNCPIETVYLQERHIAQAFQETLFEALPEEKRKAFLERAYSGASPKTRPDDAVGVQNEIRSQLLKAGKPAFVPDTFVDFDHAYRLILAMGGIPCYPTLADGASPVCEYEADPERLAADLVTRGIHAAEFIPIRNTPDVLRRYVQAMRAAGLLVTAGTEHNTLDLLPLTPTCLDGAPIPADIEEIFRAGACVVAAHQYRTLRGEPGFVDANGTPDPAYATDAERIAGYARLGAAVIARYPDAC